METLILPCAHGRAQAFPSCLQPKLLPGSEENPRKERRLEEATPVFPKISWGLREKQVCMNHSRLHRKHLWPCPGITDTPLKGYLIKQCSGFFTATTQKPCLTVARLNTSGSTHQNPFLTPPLLSAVSATPDYPEKMTPADLELLHESQKTG